MAKDAVWMPSRYEVTKLAEAAHVVSGIAVMLGLRNLLELGGEITDLADRLLSIVEHNEQRSATPESAVEDAR
jgi:hypothetical protein